MTTLYLILGLGAATLVLGGAAWWLIRRSGSQAEKMKQKEKTIDVMDKIDEARSEAEREVDEALASPSFRDSLKRLYDKYRRQ